MSRLSPCIFKKGKICSTSHSPYDCMGCPHCGYHLR